jgi:hypothetical protein
VGAAAAGDHGVRQRRAVSESRFRDIVVAIALAPPRAARTYAGAAVAARGGVLRAIPVVLLLAGCPDDEMPEPEPAFDFFAGEEADWRWSDSTCVVYMRDNVEADAKAAWLAGSRVVRRGMLSGRDTTDDFRRGSYRDGSGLAIEHGDGQGFYVKRFFYDERGRLSEIVKRGQYSTRALRTTLAYDGANRLIERITERETANPLHEVWQYGSLSPSLYWATSPGHSPYGWSITYDNQQRMAEEIVFSVF